VSEHGISEEAVLTGVAKGKDWPLNRRDIKKYTFIWSAEDLKRMCLNFSYYGELSCFKIIKVIQTRAE
jgi:hypothetical protein